MKKLEVKDLKENFFEAIGKEWMLVTAGTKEKFNTMTASWGGIGWLWNKPVAFVFIRPERYTYEFVEKNDHLTLYSFLIISVFSILQSLPNMESPQESSVSLPLLQKLSEDRAKARQTSRMCHNAWEW